MTEVRIAFLLLSALLLAACGGPRGQDYALACIFELDPPGAYGYPAGVTVPIVVPEEGGTQAGADALNACIAQKAGGATLESTGSLGGTNSVEVNGDSATQTFTYGSPRDRNGDLIQTQVSVPDQASPLSQLTPQFSAAQPGTGICNLRMTGGSGYTCEVPFNSRRN